MICNSFSFPLLFFTNPSNAFLSAAASITLVCLSVLKNNFSKIFAKYLLYQYLEMERGFSTPGIRVQRFCIFLGLIANKTSGV